MFRFNSVKQAALVSNRPTMTSAGIPNNVANDGGRVRSKSGTVALATTDLTLGDVVVLAGLPKGAVVLSIRLAADDLDSGATPLLTWNVGLYADATGLTAKNASAYATAVTLGQAATAFTDYAFEARGIELAGQKVWQDAGDTVEGGGEYFLAATVAAAPATAVAGDLSFIVEYAID